MAFRRVQTSFTAGQLDPKLKGRIDIGQYYAGAETLRNVLVQPQGGVIRRPGLAFIDELLSTLTLLEPDSISVPNGGTDTNASDDDYATLLTTTTEIQSVNPYVVVSYDLGAAMAVDFVDVTGFRLSVGSTSGEFVVQHSPDNSAWTTLGTDTLDTDTTPISHRFAAAGVSRRYWRLARVGSTDLDVAVATISGFDLWQESATVSAAQLMPFEFSVDQHYLLVFTDRAISVYLDDVLQTVVNSPYPDAALGTINPAQSLDSVILVHEDYPPYLLQRQGADDAWQMQPITFTNYPTYRFTPVDTTPSGTLTPSATEGSITLTAGAATKEIAAVRATNPAEITVEQHGFSNGASVVIADVEQPALSANINGTRTITLIDDNTFSVPVDNSGGPERNEGTARLDSATPFTWNSTHIGQYVDGNGGRVRIQAIESGSVAKGIVVVPFYDDDTIASGDWTLMTGYESAWSATRGYPRAVAFHDERLYMGGSTELPAHVWGSGVGPDRVFDFSLGQNLDDDGMAIILPASDKGVPTVQSLFSGRHLQIFCSNQERYVPQSDSSPITPQTISTRRTSGHGIRTGLTPVEVSGATLFIQREGKALREFVFVDTEQSYGARNISLLSSPLLNSPVDIALRKATSTDEADLVIVVNADGTLAFLTTLRDQEITAWSWGDTRAGDTFLNAEADGPEVYFVVARSVNDTTRHYLERFDTDLLLDCATTGAAASSYTSADAIYTNETVSLLLDGLVQSDIEFSTNTLTFPRAAASSYELGYDFTVTIKDLPVVDQAQDGTILGREKRILEAVFEVYQTTHMVVNGQEVSFQNFGEAGVGPLDTPAPSFTGRKTLEGLLGYDKYAQLTITQNVPARLALLAMEKYLRVA